MSARRSIVTSVNYQTLPDGTHVPVAGIQTRVFVTPIPHHLNPNAPLPPPPSQDHRQQHYPHTSSSTSHQAYYYTGSSHSQAQYPYATSQGYPPHHQMITAAQPPPPGWHPSSTYQSQPQYPSFTYHHVYQEQYFTTFPVQYQQPPPVDDGPPRPFIPRRPSNESFNEPPRYPMEVLDDTYDLDTTSNTQETAPHASTSATVAVPVREERKEKKKEKERRGRK